jgi:hypothetical protein
LDGIEWEKGKVEYILTDMRAFEFQSSSSSASSPFFSYFGKLDIIVSELLGSLGDNELAPECLDGGQRLLRLVKVDSQCSSNKGIVKEINNNNSSSVIDLNIFPLYEYGGISIPESSVSYLAPVSCCLLFYFF